MKLKQISFSEYRGGSQEWVLNKLTLENINLLVGKNATGKTRCLNIINSLARLVSGDVKQLFPSACYDAVFENGQKEVRYILELKNSKVLQESFQLDGKKLMTRGQGGSGTIYATEIKDNMKFQAPETSLAIVARQDEIQHDFLKCLHDWGKNVIHYAFGTPLGKDLLAVIQKDANNKFDPRKTTEVISTFRNGVKKLGGSYVEAIKKDMKQVGYDIEDIGTRAPTRFTLPVSIGGEPLGLYVKEKDLPGITEQFNISQGMFRALSLIIQVNYSQMTAIPSCILIDDIGEGLDYDRSVCLIKLLMEKVEKSPVQLIMATNDRFVMNQVPLETWSVVKRDSNKCYVYNYANSRDKFEDFKFTGMNNFDFFMSDFVDKGLPENE